MLVSRAGFEPATIALKVRYRAHCMAYVDENHTNHRAPCWSVVLCGGALWLQGWLQWAIFLRWAVFRTCAA